MSTVVGQVKVNGAADQGLDSSWPNGEFRNQFLTGHLGHLEITAAGAADISEFGYDEDGDAKAGEELLQLFASVANPVIVQSVSEDVMHVAYEVNGVSAEKIADAINSSDTFGDVTVVQGEYAVSVSEDSEE